VETRYPCGNLNKTKLYQTILSLSSFPPSLSSFPKFPARKREVVVGIKST
jgi:hypothetical protein